jgi:glycosyltransferase involved in cell wall biosynthesis
MKILILGDAYPPTYTSGAIMLRDLACELTAQSHSVTILLPEYSQRVAVHENSKKNINVIRVRALRTKDVIYIKRIIAEFINPLLMWRRLRKSNFFWESKFDLIIWYSPTIFWGPLVYLIKRHWKCPAYLILRDIFPDWAIHLGLINKYSPASLFLGLVARYQYHQAEVIGVQSPNSLSYMASKYPKIIPKAKVLWNWVGYNNRPSSVSLINISNTALAGRKLIIYAGNIGIAQGRDTFLNIINAFKDNHNVGFLFIGRGSEMEALKCKALEAGLDNALFFPQVDPVELQKLYSQCHAGLVVLDPRHKTHNIPGKFVSYMQHGLPVFGILNENNDLIDLVRKNCIGIFQTSTDLEALKKSGEEFTVKILADSAASLRCKNVYQSLFTSKEAAKNILEQVGVSCLNVQSIDSSQ